MEKILFIVYTASVGISLFYYLFFYLRAGLYQSRLRDEKPDPVSVIIAARNEASNLRTHLPDVLSQKGVDFEVVVVDDRSEDDTAHVLNEFKCPQLKVCRVPENDKFHGRGKKLALTMGIKAAANEHLVFTDADCRPASDKWLLYMAQGLMRKPVVLGVSPFKIEKGFWKRFFAFDALLIAVQYTSFALAGLPYMGVGRNMGYRKALFFETGGFKRHTDLDSGDDDLLINETADRNNVEVILHTDAMTVSKSEDSLKKWINQKIRHVSTAPRYKLLHKMLLIIMPVSQYIVFGLFVVLLYLQSNSQFVAALLGIKILTQQIVYFKCLSRLKALQLGTTGFIYEFVQLIVYPVVYLKQLNRRIELWKRM